MQFNTKINIKKIKYKIIHGVLICGVAIAFSIISVYFYRDYDFGSMNSNYLKSSDIIKLYDISNSEYLILDRESFEHFEENCIGNKSSFLSQYGEIYKNDELKCFSKESNSILSINDKDKTISESSSSYFNVIDNIVYFRNDTDFKLYSYNIKTEEIKCLLTEKVGQVIVSTKGISYISLSNHSLNFISFDNYKTTRIGDENILKYYVVGNKYLCLTTDSKLILLDSKENKVIDSNVEEFVYNGNLVVQKDLIFIYIKHLKISIKF